MRWPSRSGTLVIGLGFAQLVAWGTLYYAIAMLGEPMRAELGVAPSHVFGAFTWSLALASLLAPTVGRSLDRYGGRVVLVASALVGALGFVVLAHAPSAPWIVVGWSINGLAMALGLYDACFAAIGQTEPRAYRIVVTGITLVAGFASTVAWPLSHYLVKAIGWRGTCLTYSLALLLCAPIYAALLDGRPRVDASALGDATSPAAPTATLRRGRVLSWAFAGAALIGSSISAHLPAILSAVHLRTDHAIWVASSVGALQVFGRVVDLTFGSRRSAVTLGALTFVGLLAAMVLLLAAPVAPMTVFGFAILYGVSNGLLTIAKATLPLELFGASNVGALLGSFSAPSLVTRALAPLGFALAVSATGMAGAVASLAGVGVLSLGAYAAGTRRS